MRRELNVLERKSSEDLWKEDLAVFIEELDISHAPFTHHMMGMTVCNAVCESLSHHLLLKITLITQVDSVKQQHSPS